MVTTEEARSWTAVGAQDAAQGTYASIRRALESSSALNDKYKFEVFLQGSYANATNIRGDSDVDIVAMLTSTFIADTSLLPPADVENYKRRFSDAPPMLDPFRSDVTQVLRAVYGTAVEPRPKCIRVARGSGRLDADVVPAYQVRRFLSVPAYGDPRFVEGIRILPTSGGSILNYPKEHKTNGATKNQSCHDRYKSTVRQVKRLAVHAADKGFIVKKDVPGYVLECLVFNVSDNRFVSDDHERLIKVMATLKTADFGGFVSCDRIHTLFVTDPGRHDPTKAKRAIDVLWELI